MALHPMYSMNQFIEVKYLTLSIIAGRLNEREKNTVSHIIVSTSFYFNNILNISNNLYHYEFNFTCIYVF